jgi:Eukaryotic membrane protein family
MVAPNVSPLPTPATQEGEPSPTMAHIIPFKHPSTPPPPPPPDQPLEDRVAELEEKLATLSRLLQRQQRSASLALHHSPPRDARTVPCLDSPSPLPYHHRRSFSSKILVDNHQESPSLRTPKFPVLQIYPFSDDEDCTRSNGKGEDPTNTMNHGTESQQQQQQQQPQEDEEPKSIQAKWMDYLNSFQESTPDVDQQMEEFVRVPSQVESLLTFGIIICMDGYLYTLTILPLRAAWSCLLLLGLASGTKPKRPEFQFHRRHLYCLIQVSIIYIVYRYVLLPISIGKLYHWIRGQAMLKLYVCIAIVEVFDRLMCSMGQDCLDSMYWNTTRRPKSWRMAVSTLVVLVYAACHTLILFVHVATLNVAMNSSDQALLTLLISGNFAEIKSTVFKKYNKPNLFKIAASDICERFKLALFLTLVLMLNISQGMDLQAKSQYLWMCGVVWCAELLADWLKHSFITKFNFIRSSVYPEYALLLAGDVTGFGHEGVNLDHSHAVVKRLGFAQLPLVCVMLRLLKEGMRYAQPDGVVWLVLAWISLFGIKLALGRWLQKHCLAKLEAAPEMTNSGGGSASKRKTKRE